MSQSGQRLQLGDLQRDLRERWRSGDRRRVEDYLAEHASLKDEPEVLLELIRAEIEAERESGGSVDLAGYLLRFPELAPRLCQTELPPFNAADTHSLRAANPDSTQPHSPALGGDGACSGPASFSAGRFEIVRPHAKGGLGEVFVAADLELNREVALKQIQTRLADYADSRARFLLEAEITGMLEHPGIVPVYSLGAYPNGSPFYAMRFIRGASLKQAIHDFHSAHRNSPSAFETVEFRKLLTRFVSVCHAIAYAHSRGVLHRDLKPDNIMLGDYGETLVVDWGLAKALGRKDGDGISVSSQLPPVQPRTQTEAASVQGQIIGTPAFMPPEQAEGKLDQLATSADIYSLGATLFMLLTGEPPFKGKNTDEILTQVRSGTINQPRTLRNSIPKPLEAICAKAMSRHPGDRYATASALAEEVERWLADEPVQAFPEPLAVRARRWIRKHPGPMAALAATIVLGLVGAATLAYINGRHAQELSLSNATIGQQNSELSARNSIISRQRTDLEQTNAKLVESRDDEAKAKNQAKATTDFLVSSFGKVDPEQDGKKLTVFEVLVRAKQELEAQTSLDSLQKVEMLHALGMTFLGLGIFDEAVSANELAFSIVQERLGRDHPATLSSMGNLAAAYQGAGKLDRALPLHEEALRLKKARLGEDHPSTLAAMNNLGNAYYSAGKLDLGVSLLQEALRRMKARLEEYDPQTLNCMGNLAGVYLAQGNLDVALPLLEESFTLMKASFGEDHPKTLATMSNLARAYTSLGKLEQGLLMYKEVVRIQTARLGEDHPATLMSRNSLAATYEEVGQLDQAVTLNEESLRLTRAKLGDDHPDTLHCMNSLARAYSSAGKLNRSLPLYAETLSRRKATLGEDHPDTLISMNGLAMAYRAAGKIELALPLMEATMQSMKATLGDAHPDTLGTMNNLALSYHSAGRLDQALPLYEQTLRLMQSKYGEDHPATLMTMRNLATGYQAVGKFDLALPMYEKGLRLTKAKLGDDHPDTLALTNNLATGYYLTGQLQLALPLFEETLRIKKAKLGDDHPSTVTSMNNLARGFQAAGKLDSALSLFEEALRLSQAKLGENHPDTLATLQNTAIAFLDARQYAKAISLFDDYLRHKRKQASQTDPAFAGALASVAQQLLAAEQFESVEPYLNECLAIRKAVQPEEWSTFNTQSMLGGSLLGRKKYSEAEPLLIAGYEGLKQREGKIPAAAKVRLTEAVQRLVDLYTAWEKPEEAAKWKDILDASTPAPNE